MIVLEGWCGAVAIRRLLAEQGNLACHGAPLALEVIGHGAAQTGIGDVVGAVGLARQIAAGELVRPLRAGLDPAELVGDGKFDGLVVADLEMEEGVIFQPAPIAAV